MAMLLDLELLPDWLAARAGTIPKSSSHRRKEKMRFALGVMLAALLFVPVGRAAEKAVIDVYKSRYCGCCNAWVDIMRKEGFEIKSIEVEDLSQIKRKAGLQPSEGSCHTAFVAGYALEGHVPPDAVRKLLKERPKIKGLTVPGMPANSPGMGRMDGTLKTYEIETGKVYSID
jgi:hypothetical protein